MSSNPFEFTAALKIVRDWNEFSGSDFLKSDNSGSWSQNGAPADPGPYLPMNYRFVFQRWLGGRVIDTKDPDKFDLDELNATIPEAEWEPGFNIGEKRRPYSPAKQLILMNFKTGAQVIYSGGNTRTLIAVTNLIDQIRSKNFLFGRTASPVVELASAPFKTQFGTQKRGDFRVMGRWVDLSGNQLVTGRADKQLPEPNLVETLKQLPEPALAEELNDEIPF